MRKFIEVPKKKNGKDFSLCFVNVDTIDGVWLDKVGRDYAVYLTVGARTHHILETKKEKEARDKYIEIFEKVRRA